MTHVPSRLSQRRKSYIKARNETKSVTLPIIIGNTVVHDLGALLVEEGPGQPAFHNASSLWPIGYKATYRDPVTSITYDCEIADGIDCELAKSVPVFVIHVHSSSPFIVQGISEREAWQKVWERQLAEGTPKEREAARTWEHQAFDQRFGTQELKVRKALEGLCGSFDCFCYEYIDTDDVMNEPLQKSSFVGERSGKRLHSSPNGNVRSNKQKIEKQIELPKGASRRNLSVDPKQGSQIKTSHERADSKSTGGGKGRSTSSTNNVTPRKLTNADDEASDEEWHQTGSEYIGKRVQIKILDDASGSEYIETGRVFGWLPADVADFKSDQGEYVALWRVKFDDRHVTSQDLEEFELKEAIAEYDRAHISGPNASGPSIKSKSSKDTSPLIASCQDRSGQHSGKLAPLPSGSPPTFPKECFAEFLIVFAFLEDFASILEIDKLSLQSAEALLTEPSAAGYCELALKLTRAAVRSKYVREADDSEKDMNALGVRKLSHMLLDLKLAPGPLLSAEMKVSETVRYCCWQLVNECSWPTIALMLVEMNLDRVRYSDLLFALAGSEPGDFQFNVKIGLLSFLCDEICGSDIVRNFLSKQLQQTDRLQERKRKEDSALKKLQDLPRTKTKALNMDSKSKAVNGVESEAGKLGRKSVIPVSDIAPAKSKVLEALELMKILFDRDPQHFEVRYKEKVVNGLLDISGLMTKIRSEGQVFDSVSRWICFICKKQKISIPSKSLVFYKGRSLKEWEQDLIKSSAGERGAAPSSELPSMVDVDDEFVLPVDMERRRREYEAALRRVEKGFRVEPLGYDRALRSYWSFQSLADSSSQVVWVCEPGVCKGVLPGKADLQDATAVAASPDYLAAACLDRVGSKRAANPTQEKWYRFTAADGSLQRLSDYVKELPQGPREMRLLEQLQSLISKSNALEKKLGEASANDDPNGANDSLPSEDYVWKMTPEIGDIVWARKRSETRNGVSFSWHPVKLVDPKAEEPATDDDDEVRACREDDDEEWHQTGSEYIGKRVLMTIRDDVSGSELTETGRVFGWLPADVADFKSDQGEYVALWRVKFDDRHVTPQDLEEFELKEAIAKYSRERAVKRSKDLEYLSQTSMFGQKIKWVHGQYMNSREHVEKFSVSDIRPYEEFRTQRVQEIEALGSSKVMAQVQRADEYLEERNAGENDGENIKEILLELGLGGLVGEDLSPELEAACRCCMQQPRVMAVVERGQDKLPAVCTIGELNAQLFALVDCLKISYLGSEEDIERFRSWREAATAADSLAGFTSTLRSLNDMLCDIVDSASKSEETRIDLGEWRGEGHEWIGKRLRRPLHSRSGRATTFVNATVVGWLSAEESDFLDELKMPAPLWHVVWDDGEEEDLEEAEVREGFRRLLECGDNPDLCGRWGIWAAARDRDVWSLLVAGARTLGAAALALYLLGDRAMLSVGMLVQDARLAAEDWDDHCWISGEGGSLMCCDSCPRTAKPSSLGWARAPKGDFLCAYCQRDEARRARRSRGGGRGQVSAAAGSKAGADGGEKRGKKLGVGAWSEEVEKLRKSIGRYGLHNGCICEVVPDERAERAGERWFVKVLDGSVARGGGGATIASCQHFTAWSPSAQRRMVLRRGEAPMPIARIMSAGKLDEILDGNYRRGFRPAAAK